MKTLIKILAPVLAYSFLIAITLSQAGQGLQARVFVPPPHVVKLTAPDDLKNVPVNVRQKADGSTLLVECSTNLIDWVVLTNVDLSTATINPDTGQQEIFVQVVLDDSFVMSTAGFFKNVLTSNDISTNLPVAFFAKPSQPIPYNSFGLTSAGYPFNVFANKLIKASPPFPIGNVVGIDDAAYIALAIIMLIVGAIVIYLLYLWIKSLGL